MPTDMITLKLDRKFLKEIDAIVEQENYQNRTEFIRQSLRDTVSQERRKTIMAELRAIQGSSKKKVTEAEYEAARARI